MADLMKALRNAHAAGDTVSAKRIAGMIKAQSAPQPMQGPQQPAQEQAVPWYTPVTSAPRNAYDIGAGLVSGVKNTASHMFDTIDTPMGKIPLGPVAGPFKATMESLYGAVKPIVQDPVGSYNAADQYLSEKIGTPTRLWNTVATHPIDTLLFAAPGVGQMGKAATLSGMTRTGAALTKAGGLLDPVNLVTKPIEKAYTAMQSPMRDAARSLNVPKGSLMDVGNSIGDIGAAQAQSGLLGPDAMAAHLSPQATQDARALAAMSLKDGSSAELSNRAQGVIDRSGSRASADWEQTVGPAKSRFDKSIELTKQKLQSSSPYEAAKGVEVDATPLYEMLPKIAEKVKFNPQAAANIDELQKMITDQYKGTDALHNAGDLMGVRQRIDEMIKSAGAGQTVTPGTDLYQLGSRTTTGRVLMDIRKTINETLHRDPRLAIADRIFAGAEKQKSAFELGNKKLIGSGDNAIEPQLLAKQFNGMAAEERRAVLEGLSRKGKTAIGDVRPNRNDGKAMADAFATPNNLQRLDAMGLDSGRIKKMAEREDALASGSNRILGGSDTARTDLAKSKYQPIGSLKDYAGSGPVTAGLLGAAYALGTSNPILGAALAGSGVGVKGLLNMARAKKASGAAKLLSRQGPELQGLLKALETAKNTKAKPLAITAKNRALVRGLLSAHMAQP